jgi:hypothetical protein
MRLTVMAIHPIISLISRGFNQSKPPLRTVVVALDLSKEFDTVDIPLLLEQITLTDLHPNIVCWLSAYLRGRSAACVFQGVAWVFRTVHAGVPQGSVLLPTLFNFFVSDCPETSGLTVLYADDLLAAATGLDLNVIKANFNLNMAAISAWARRKKLTISREKSQVTLFTSNTKEVFFEGTLAKRVRYLGVIHDMFGTNAQHALSKIPAKAKVVKATMGPDWGFSMEEGLLTYRAIVEPTITNGFPIWMPILKNSWIEELQRAQNAMLRTNTGCHDTKNVRFSLSGNTLSFFQNSIWPTRSSLTTLPMILLRHLQNPKLTSNHLYKPKMAKLWNPI